MNHLSGSSAGLPKSIREAGLRLRDGDLSIENLTRLCLERISVCNPELHALITVSDTQALQSAAQLDIDLARGRDRGPLHGIPIVHKDNIDTEGVRTTVGSGHFRARFPAADADAASALREAGAISLGKTNLPEFASHPSGRNPFYGDLRNPLDSCRSAGGSSGGTAAAIAAGLCLAGTGTDTGGSLRIPASWCGIVGLRPTFGLVSNQGVYGRAYSLDSCGPMAGNVYDSALLLDAMVTYRRDGEADPLLNTGSYIRQIKDGIGGTRIGVLNDFLSSAVEPGVAGAFRKACDAISASGGAIRPVRSKALMTLEIPRLMDMLQYEFNQILGAEYHATNNRDVVFSEVVRAGLTAGAAIPQRQYAQIQHQRAADILEFDRAFDDVDVLITPTTPMVAPLMDTTEAEWARARYFTLPFSYLGVPSISIPCGHSESMPVGMQIVARRFNEPLLLKAAFAMEQAFAQQS